MRHISGYISSLCHLDNYGWYKIWTSSSFPPELLFSSCEVQVEFLKVKMKICLILIISIVACVSASVGIDDGDAAGTVDEDVTVAGDVNASVGIGEDGSASTPGAPDGSGGPFGIGAPYGSEGAIGIGVPKIVAGAGLAAEGAADVLGLGGQASAAETGQARVSNNDGRLTGSVSKNVAAEVGGLGHFAGGFGVGLASSFGGYRGRY